MKSGAIGSTPNTPSVFCAVSAVTAVIAKASSIVTVLMSAWMPAPPPESDPAMIRTRPFIGTIRASSRPGELFRRVGGRSGRGLDRLGAAGHRQDRRANFVDDGRQQAL